jgi:hypothetical protein
MIIDPWGTVGNFFQLVCIIELLIFFFFSGSVVWRGRGSVLCGAQQRESAFHQKQYACADSQAAEFILSDFCSVCFCALCCADVTNVFSRFFFMTCTNQPSQHEIFPNFIIKEQINKYQTSP